MNTKASKCKCGCGKSVPPWADYVPGHDLKHLNKLVDRAGGVDKLSELLRLVEAYIAGETTEAELTKEIRRLRVKQS
jgi:hypothetical protein